MKNLLLGCFFLYSEIFSVFTGQIKSAVFITIIFVFYLFLSLYNRRQKSVNPYPMYFILIMISALTFVTHLKHMIIQPYQVENRSMEPLLEPGDNVLVEKISMGLIVGFYEHDRKVKRISFPWNRKLKVGDIVILKNPIDHDNLIKRIHSIENGKYCVYGDNLEQSLDSRRFGCVKEEVIIGRLIYYFKTEA